MPKRIFIMLKNFVITESFRSMMFPGQDQKNGPKNSILRCVLKINLRTKTFSAVKMNLLELNLSRIDTIFQLETGELRKMVGDYFTTQEKLRIIVIVIYNDLDSFFSFQIIPSVSTAFTGQPLQIPCSSLKVNPLCKKTDPRENPERNSGYAVG